MKTLRDYITEAEIYVTGPVAGDEFDIEIAPGEIVSTYVIESTGDSITVYGDEKIIALLETMELTKQSPRHINEGVMKDVAITLGEIADTEDFDRLYDLMTSTTPAGQMVQKIANDISIDNQLYDDDHEELLELVMDRLIDDFGGQDIDEAKYQGREVPLGKPMRGDVKKSKVYVRGPKGNVVKVNFGDPDMKIKKSNPKRRKSFRARHNCKNPGPRWKARYWSCRAW